MRDCRGGAVGVPHIMQGPHQLPPQSNILAATPSLHAAWPRRGAWRVSSRQWRGQRFMVHALTRPYVLTH
ncbi:hypothetical protein E2C01_045773 [Portunus trituberculatus]|uniref:Uncharacterized protein n=1 Tax=Portunus trituberculatus TaxID=210409 RepID=A0A5B7G2A0_PORTR|nr:hypothetical protein [Portunus trituberculatus]